MGIVLLWVLCDVDAKTEECSMGQKWPGSSTPAVASHWLAACGESGLRVYVCCSGYQRWQLLAFLTACCPLKGNLSRATKTATEITPTPQGYSKDEMNDVCATPSSGEKTGGQRDKVT